MDREDDNDQIEKDLFNPLILDETLSGGELYDQEGYDDSLNDYDLPIDEMSYADFAALERQEEKKEAPLFSKDESNNNDKRNKISGKYEEEE